MIQRLQSVFLLLSALALGALFFVPFANSDMATSQFLADKVYDVKDHVVLSVLAGGGTLLSIIAIFLFNNRGTQLRLSIFATIFSILLMVTAVLLFYNEASNMAAEASVNDQLGTYLPVVALLFSGLAIHFIRKDEKLVKSMDRLR